MRIGATIAGRFTLDKQAGEGGMGTVYRAIDRQTGDRVAVKLLAGGAPVDRFLREAKLLEQMNDPAIVRHVAHGTTEDGEPFLAMEWLEGEDLSVRLERGALSPRDAVNVALRLARGLATLHAHGVVHRDVKPANVFLELGAIDRVKILDLGVARAPLGGTKLTRTGAVAGTAGYLAPEQARGASADARADVFALGCVLFECLTGRRAFPGDHLLAVLARILLEEPPRAGDFTVGLPAELDALVTRMLAKEPDERPADGEAAVHELERVTRLTLDVGPISRTQLPASLRVITETEQRVVSVVLAQAAIADTIVTGNSVDIERGFAEIERMRGARLETLADGSLLVVFSSGAPTDRAAQAAHAALRIRDLLEGAHVSIVTGRLLLSTTNDGGPLLGDAIDRAASFSELAPRVSIDETTVRLIDERFEVRGDGPRRELVGVRAGTTAVRKLLGKPTPCVGRERELGVLTGLLDEVVAEQVARCALVTGPPGIGKSRVRDEFMRRAERLETEAFLLFGRADPIGKNSAFALVGQALRRAAGIFEGEPTLLKQAKLAAFVGSTVPDDARRRVTEFLGEVVGAPFVDDPSPGLRAARSDALLMNDRIRAAFAELLAAESAHRPVLVVLEDLHWGDLPTVTLLDHVLGRLGDRPILIVALARPEVEQVFPKLWSTRAVTEVGLGELSKKASERLVREVLGAVPEALVARLVDHASGNAFYLEELIRAAADAKNDAAAMELPGTVIAMVQARLDALDLESRRVLRAASVFGKVFWKSALAAPLGESINSPSIEARLVELEAREIIERRSTSRFAGEEELVFRHALVREAAYELLTDDDRKTTHRHAARWLEKTGESDACVLAEHFERSDEPARAAVCWLRAAEQALEGNDLDAVVTRIERAVELGLEGEELGRAEMLRAAAHRWRGENPTALAAARAAVELLPAGETAWCAAMTTSAIVLGRLSRYDELSDVFARTKSSGAMERSPAASVSVLARITNSFLNGGHLAPADEALAALHIVAAPLEAGDPEVRALLHFAQSTRELARGQGVRALEESSIAAASFRAAGDRRAASTASINVGCACMELGDYERAVEALEASLVDAIAVGATMVSAAVEINLGWALGRAGDLVRARDLLDKSATAMRNAGDARGEAAALVYLAQVLLAGGDLAAAGAVVDRAIEVASISKPGLAMALGVRAEIDLAAGRAAPALAAARGSMQLFAEIGSALEDGDVRLRLAYAEALAANAFADEACGVLVELRDLVRERAARTPSPFRERYLAVAENARVLALAPA